MDDTLKKEIEERFGSLPKVIQDAIASSNVEKSLRELANRHKLHLDQWEKLEKEVMLTLLGFENPADLQENIKKEVGVADETAVVLTEDVSRIVFEPIREELERELEHPEAKEKEVSGVEQARAALTSEQKTVNSEQQMQQIENREQEDQKTVSREERTEISEQKTVNSEQPIQPMQPANPSPPMVPAATPPQPSPTERAVRAPVSSVYKAGEPSSVRKNIHDDPYRESPG